MYAVSSGLIDLAHRQRLENAGRTYRHIAPVFVCLTGKIGHFFIPAVETPAERVALCKIRFSSRANDVPSAHDSPVVFGCDDHVVVFHPYF